MKQRTVRIICWALAGLMLFGVIFAVVSFFAG
jgi:hypothetical protein